MEESEAVAIVGSGSVAQALGRVLINSGAPVVAVAARTRSNGETAARFIGGHTSHVEVIAITDVPRVATRVLVAVSDRAVVEVAGTLASAGMRSGIALHTCGAKGPEALAPLRSVGVACGLLHPLQTFASPQQGAGSLEHIAWGVCGDPSAEEWAADIVSSLHGQTLRIAANRLGYYHAGAVMASNAVAAVIDAAIALLEKADVDAIAARRALEPLTRTSVANIFGIGPQAAATGPIVRGDAESVSRHMRALHDVDDSVANLYEASAAHLLELAKRRGLAETSVRAVEAALHGESNQR